MILSNHQLQYHFHPENGWINDPNGLCCFDGYYHIFFQYSPNYETPWHEAMIWGHSRTKDFLNFEELPVAMVNDKPYDIGGVWSGTAVEIDRKLWLFYASVDSDMRQTISAASSEDGIHFVKCSENPIISDLPVDGSRDFRDPAVLIDNGNLYLVIASADVNKGTGNLLLYQGDDISHWKYIGVLYEYPDCKYCECPSFVHCEDGFILSASVVRKDESHYFEVLYGDFDGKSFSAKAVSHFQKGPDEYAGQIFRASDGRNLMMSWIPGWSYQPKEKCIGCLSIPLEIIVENEKIRAYPISEVAHLIAEDGTITDSYIRETYENHGEFVTVVIDKEKL
ncbi:MAG: glycoside hydrolase family 32 protein [Clostridiales bacterium]|nr:glycoside hydrolase family 32 protein [Clostridiales bacterium]